MAKKEKQTDINNSGKLSSEELQMFLESLLEIGMGEELDSILSEADHVERNEHAPKLPSLCDKSKNPVAYVLYISIDQCPVKVFRRLRVPSNLRLEYLAELILVAMGWYGYHLHQFSKNGVLYVSPERFEEDWDFGFRMRRVNAMNCTVGDVLLSKGDTIKFEYDFGDSWMHTVRVSSIDDSTNADTTIRLLSGKGACPPEDCGGVWGYSELLENGEADEEEANDFLLDEVQEEIEMFLEEMKQILKNSVYRGYIYL